jgi:hypothetical protein
MDSDDQTSEGDSPTEPCIPSLSYCFSGVAMAPLAAAAASAEPLTVRPVALDLHYMAGCPAWLQLEQECTYL